MIDLLGNRVAAEIGVAFFVAAYSALRRVACPARAARARRHEHPGEHQAGPLAGRAASGRDGQRRRRALIPIENKRSFLDVSSDVLETIDPIFFGDVRTAGLKALGLN